MLRQGAVKLMKRVNLLIGNSDRRINNIIEAAVRDVCYNLALVECFRTSRIDQFLRLASHPGFDLVFIAPNALIPEPSRKIASLSTQEVLNVIQKIKNQRIVPVFAVAVPPGLQAAVLEAGADKAFGLAWDGDSLKSEVCQVLRLPDHVRTEHCESNRWSLLSTLMRGFQFASKSKG